MPSASRWFALLLAILLLPGTFSTTSLGSGLARGVAQMEPDRGKMTVRSSAYVAHIARPFVCSPAPCILPNQDASTGPFSVNETPVAVNPNNPQQILTAANDDNCKLFADEGIYASSDGGNTWTRSCLGPISAGYVGEGDPVVAYDLLGNAYAGGFELGAAGGVVAITKSSDNGTTWSTPVLAVPTLLGVWADKPWLQIDTDPHSPFVNSLYISATQVNTNHDTEISVSHSTDGGTTWTTVAVDAEQFFPQIEEFSDLATDPNGTVYLTWMRCTGNGPANTCAGTTATLELSKSTDGGNTWSQPQAMFTAQLAPPGYFCFYGALPNTDATPVSEIPSIAVDHSSGPHRGSLYVAYYTWTGTYMKVMLATSTDGGVSWTSQPVAPALASTPHDQFFPWVSVSPSGIVGVSWLDRRNDPANVKYEAFAAFSLNGGASFGRNYNLSAALSNPGQTAGDFFIGDYTGNAWSPDSRTFYVTYTDTTTGVAQDFLAGIQR